MSEENPFAELESIEPKTKRWVIVFEKVVAGLVIVLGLLLAISILAVLHSFYFRDYLPQTDESGIIDLIISYWVHIVFSIFTIYAGILLLFKKRLGWIFTTATLSATVVFIVYIVYRSGEKMDASYLIVILIVLLLPCASLFFLNGRDMRRRYGAMSRDYAIAGGVFLFLLILWFWPF
ncbi:MAG: hypothetical protein KTR22_04540 [Flavobacteriaceae bacterium]|nr:hypothetical protein [Flavobacteriaceae bacterium]